MKEWIKSQFDWIKLLLSEDKLPSAPSHKNFIALTLLVIFCIAYLKTTLYLVATPGKELLVPDIPSGWQLVFLGILGIRAFQSATEKITEHKYKNGNGHSNGVDKDPLKTKDPLKP